MSLTSPLRFAIIGAGMQGAALATALAELPSGAARVRVVCDLDEDAAGRVAAEVGAEACRDYRDAVTHPEVDAVVVAVPPGLHREVAVAAARAGRHVFCEKPLAVELEDADAIVEACDEACDGAGVTLSVGYLFRWAENRDHLRRVLQDGVIGRPVLWRETLPPGTESQGWLGDPKLGGGALFEYSHSIDFACYTLGEVEAVSARIFGFREDPGWTTHDSYICRVDFESGDVFHLSGFAFLPLGMDFTEQFGGSHRFTRVNDIVGTEGAIYAGEDRDGELGLFVSRHPATDRQRVERTPWAGWGGFAENPTPVMLQEFIDAVLAGRRDTRSSGATARDTLAVVQAALESSRTGETVRL